MSRRPPGSRSARERRRTSEGNTPIDGPGHYREAERLIAAARIHTDHYYGEPEAMPTLLAALVHAQLASTAVAATGSSAEWMKAAGTKFADLT